ncbi:MAG: DinB family protein [Thermoanaerobaculia bacterium]
MHTTFWGTLLFYLLASARVALGQESPPTAVVAPAANPLSAHTKLVHGGMKMALLGSAEKMPEENYDFRPTESVRSFGQIVGHVADSQYLFCSMALGEKNPAPGIEKTRTSKADLVAALKDAFAYCDRAYDGMTDASAADIVKLMGRDTPKLSVLTVNSVHNAAHYGNLVTYLRMKNIVPPTSEPGFMTKARQ